MAVYVMKCIAVAVPRCILSDSTDWKCPQWQLIQAHTLINVYVALIVQVWCGKNRFPVSATMGTTCVCSNIFPSTFYKVCGVSVCMYMYMHTRIHTLTHNHTHPHTQVAFKMCDFPCSPDQTKCLFDACCGSKDNTKYTVAFSGEVCVCACVCRCTCVCARVCVRIRLVGRLL